MRYIKDLVTEPERKLKFEREWIPRPTQETKVAKYLIKGVSRNTGAVTIGKKAMSLEDAQAAISSSAKNAPELNYVSGGQPVWTRPHDHMDYSIVVAK